MSDKLFEINGQQFTIEDLYCEIYNNSKEKREKILGTFDVVSKYVIDISSALSLLPEITKLQMAAIAADEQLIKLANIANKSNKAKPSADIDFDLSDEELKQISDLARQSFESNIPSGGK